MINIWELGNISIFRSRIFFKPYPFPQGTSRNNPVVEWVEPETLPTKIDLPPNRAGESHATLLGLLSSVIRYSVKTGHPHFVNQLYSSVDPYGLVGQWLTDALNPSVYTYEVSPVFSLMEEVVLREMRAIVGWQVMRMRKPVLDSDTGESHRVKAASEGTRGFSFVYNKRVALSVSRLIFCDCSCSVRSLVSWQSSCFFPYSIIIIFRYLLLFFDLWSVYSKIRYLLER